jgi:RNA-binding protein YhbY
VKVGHAGSHRRRDRGRRSSLTAHGLIKVKIGGLDRDERAAIAEAIGARTDATTVQRIGKVRGDWADGG